MKEGDRVKGSGEAECCSCFCQESPPYTVLGTRSYLIPCASRVQRTVAVFTGRTALRTVIAIQGC